MPGISRGRRGEPGERMSKGEGYGGEVWWKSFNRCRFGTGSQYLCIARSERENPKRKSLNGALVWSSLTVLREMEKLVRRGSKESYPKTLKRRNWTSRCIGNLLCWNLVSRTDSEVEVGVVRKTYPINRENKKKTI